jgi:Asp-tRNA(Asn)/Glu-tRNA(Gln) amidotransferase B subunit
LGTSGTEAVASWIISRPSTALKLLHVQVRTEDRTYDTITELADRLREDTITSASTTMTAGDDWTNKAQGPV